MIKRKKKREKERNSGKRRCEGTHRGFSWEGFFRANPGDTNINTTISFDCTNIIKSVHLKKIKLVGFEKKKKKNIFCGGSLGCYEQ